MLDACGAVYRCIAKVTGAEDAEKSEMRFSLGAESKESAELRGKDTREREGVCIYIYIYTRTTLMQKNSPSAAGAVSRSALSLSAEKSCTGKLRGNYNVSVREARLEEIKMARLDRNDIFVSLYNSVQTLVQQSNKSVRVLYNIIAVSSNKTRSKEILPQAIKL